MDKKQITFSMMLAVIVLAYPGIELIDYITDDYVVCNEGRLYGEWVNYLPPSTFMCNVTGEIETCYRVTKTRCYFYNETAITNLYLALNDSENITEYLDLWNQTLTGHVDNPHAKIPFIPVYNNTED